MMGHYAYTKKIQPNQCKGQREKTKEKKENHATLANILIRSAKDATLKATQNWEN